MFVGIQRDIEKVNLPINWNPRLIKHKAADMAIITLLLFQMAKLESSVSTYLGKRVVAWKPSKHRN